MDISDDDRSLPTSKWSRRHDFVDMCATSPPSDGFFYPSQSSVIRQQQQGPSSSACEQKTSTGFKVTVQTAIEANTLEACSSSDQGFFKSFPQTGNYGEITSSDNSQMSGKILNMDSRELESWAKDNIRDTMAPTPVDHVPQYQRVALAEGKKAVSSSTNSLKLVEKLTYAQTPDVTPCTTPGVTPASSPHLVRKVGNPFFTGDAGQIKGRDAVSSNWLFRPGSSKEKEVFYEAKLEIKSSATATQPPKPTVRYVPKPSKLRELNFFSPTSM